MAKIIIEKNKREYLSKYGMNALQLQNKLKKIPISNEIAILEVREIQNVENELKKPVVRGKSKLKRRQRPEKLSKTDNITDLNLLIDTPNVSSKTTSEYPTPNWFNYKYNFKPDVSVIIPLYKSNEVVKDLIESWDFSSDLKVEVIFIDDNCPNDTKSFIVGFWKPFRKNLPNGVGKILYNSENKGYGGACNAGADIAQGKYIIYLNSDTRVTKNWIKPIVDVFESNKEVGIVGNLQLKEGGKWNNTIDGAGSEWLWRHKSFLHIGRHSFKKKELVHPYTVEQAPKEILTLSEREMVTGCCLAIRSDINKNIGGFNPNYRIGYWEDSDICLTVREKGWKIMFQPDSVIYHKLGHTNSGTHVFHDFNRNFFYNKWVTSGRIDSMVSDKRSEKPEIKNILLQRKGAHGDVLVASYIAGALKKKYPSSNISFYTKCPAVLENHPYIDKILTNDDQFSERQFQLIYNLDMVYEYRPFTPIIESYADVVGVKVEDCKPTIGINDFNIEYEKYIVIHSGSTSWVGRSWDKFSEIANKLLNLNKKVICIGKEGDSLIPCSLDLRGKTTIQELASIIKKSELFLGIDSLPFHIAQAVNTPGLCFFGSIDPKLRIYKPNFKSIKANNLPCLGCHHRKPRPSVVTNICEIHNQSCINDVSVEMFWNQVNLLIS